MNFRVSARTILHLGSELISSDGIAFYELIKNSLDARSPEIRVDVLYRLEYRVYDAIMRALGENRDDPDWMGSPTSEDGTSDSQGDWRRQRRMALDGLVAGAPDVDDLRAEITGARTRSAFIEVLRDANQIEVDDDGEGMSMDILERVYLTIGTSYRADQKRRRRRQARTTRPDSGPDLILGEKGLGRLSAMRLGDRVTIITGERGSSRWNQLEIDWNDFADAADQDLESVDVSPVAGEAKRRDQTGTLIRISALRAEWSSEKLEALAVEQFSKLVDPFEPDARLPLRLTFNSDPLPIPTFAGFLLEHAHGRLTARFRADGPRAPRLDGEMEYRLHRRRAPLRLSTLDLETLTEHDEDTLERVGPFDLEVYWFNRRILTKIEGIGSLAVVRRILATWAGGVSVYRDGYRVNPYGGPNDDWLDLDRDAFSTSGFKLNRGQIIGRARIGQAENRFLIDQTNREGLKDNPEKRAFVKVISSVVELYRQYIVEIDKDVQRSRRVTAADAIARFRAEDDRLGGLLPQLEEALAQTSNGTALSRRIATTLQQLREAAADVQAAAGAQDEERGRVMHLASIGLMIEILAHELYRATSAGLRTIAQARSARDPTSAGTSLRVLDAQLRTLQKRLKVLDPLSTNARQTREDFELVGWIGDIAGGFADRNRASRVRVQTLIRPRGSTLVIRAVKGMFVQVLENLLTNSLFWIAQRHRQQVKAGLARDDDDLIGEIVVTVDTGDRRISITDDGPGIPEERREIVFQPFFSTRPQKQGRGLGLYIAREIAEYHGGSLYLGDADEHGQIHSVIFEIGNTHGE